MIHFLIVIYAMFIVALTTWVIILKKHTDHLYQKWDSIHKSVKWLDNRGAKYLEPIEAQSKEILELKERITTLEQTHGDYSDKFISQCLYDVAQGISIREVSRNYNVPYSTLRMWVKKNGLCILQQ